MGNRVKELRRARGLSQEELAERANTTKVQISRLENGMRKLTEDWIWRLAEALDCQPAEVIADAVELQPDEKALLDAYRQLAEPEKAAFRHIAETMGKAKP